MQHYSGGLLSAFAFAVYKCPAKEINTRIWNIGDSRMGMLIGGILVTPFTKVWNVPGHWVLSQCR